MTEAKIGVVAGAGISPQASPPGLQKNNWPGGGGTRPVGERRKWYMNFD